MKLTLFDEKKGIWVVFDETKTSLDDIRKALSKAGFPLEGEPLSVK